jgi:general nucleoside transport system permease protein
MGIFDTNLLASALLTTTPILLAAMGELISERAGIINIGLEGMMLFGAYFAFWAADASQSLWLGVFAGVGAGAALAGLMGVLAIESGADQVISGIGIYILAIGLTTFSFQATFSNAAQAFLLPLGAVSIPLLDRLPIVGSAVFKQSPLVYAAFLLVPFVSFLLYRMTWGLALRAAGDLPEAAEINGLSVRRTRWLAVLTAGALAGAGGAFLSIGDVGTFLIQMTAGRGFLALAAVIFGGWRPAGVLGAAFLFGGADALQLRLQGQPSVPQEVWAAAAVLVALLVIPAVARRRRRSRDARPTRSGGAAVVTVIAAAVALAITHPSFQLPAQFWLALPFVLTLVALASLRRRAAMPRHLGIPYIRGAEA